jgi:hypothetical protein
MRGLQTLCCLFLDVEELIAYMSTAVRGAILHQPDPVNIVTKVFTDWQGLVTWCSHQQLGLTSVIQIRQVHPHKPEDQHPGSMAADGWVLTSGWCLST